MGEETRLLEVWFMTIGLGNILFADNNLVLIFDSRNINRLGISPGEHKKHADMTNGWRKISLIHPKLSTLSYINDKRKYVARVTEDCSQAVKFRYLFLKKVTPFLPAQMEGLSSPEMTF